MTQPTDPAASPTDSAAARPQERTDGVRVPVPAGADPNKALRPGGPDSAAIRTRRRFGGTESQIRGALWFYMVCAWVSGTFLLLLVAEMITRYGFGYDLIAGGTWAATGESNVLGMRNNELMSIEGGVNISTWILIIHGWFYVVYLFSCFRIWLMMRWPFPQLIVMALGGVVPFLSFFVERKIHRTTTAELAANPKAAKRY
ncbi:MULTISPECIES: DUF3817 domain-containing protein [Kocuria]|uniref:DUF3817 domain-containing protein n=1 Tax=Kocuria subflava TaxID=1736139 RepID=A0A846U8X9_9MICC|nr:MULTISPECIES: DUF3817 domain-containing protein [Kocuria]NKE10016.1 DUF3817 domain-containing protein [Kocuria subflava]